jgi:hypothetical protein
MKTTVGLFSSPADARAAATRLRAIGIPDDRVNLLLPGASPDDVARVPRTDTEQPGTGAAMGGVVGAVTGAAGGLAWAGVLLPGVGPVVAVGVIAAALVGAGGAAVGAAVEGALAHGVPKDELFLYEDALRRGRSVVFVLTEDQAQGDAARRALREAGAEDLDAARERWWIGLRSVEAEQYREAGGDFARDEACYRLGFEAALRENTRGRVYDDVVEYLGEQYPDAYRDPAFRRGFERGRAYEHGSRRAA